MDKITLNASPYAVPFYHTLGFIDIDDQKEYNGILYTPMELNNFNSTHLPYGQRNE